MGKYELTEKEEEWLYNRNEARCTTTQEFLNLTRCKNCRYWDDLMETCAVRGMDQDWQDVAEFSERVAGMLAGDPDLEADAEDVVFTKEGKSLGFSFEILKLARIRAEQEMEDADKE